MSEIITTGRALDTEKGVVVQTTRPDIPNLSEQVLVVWQDARMRTPEQIRKAWALMGEIAEYQGETKDDVYAEQKTTFTVKHLDILQGELFRLSSATVSAARAFITMLVEIIIEYGIPTKEPLYGLCDDIHRYVYACLMNKKCAVCGRKTELHHYDHVGMGRNRHEIDHLGMRAYPLCREHHDEIHQIGERAFDAKYHLEPIEIDEKIARKYGLRGGKE